MLELCHLKVVVVNYTSEAVMGESHYLSRSVFSQRTRTSVEPRAALAARFLEHAGKRGRNEPQQGSPLHVGRHRRGWRGGGVP